MAGIFKEEKLDGENNHHEEPGVDSPTFQEHDPHYEKVLIRKIDRRLLPILGALYSIALVDRVNVSAARVAGMDEDLNLSIGDRWSIVLVVFFIPYFIFELPSNIVLRKVGSANWLSFIAFAWGTVMLGQGFVKSWDVLAACRVLLGLFESGFFPVFTRVVERFLTLDRLAIFYLVSVLIGGFSSILAFGLQQMEGTTGLRGWQWIFIIEGLITQVVAIGAWFVIIDFPDKATRKGFLSAEEGTFIAQRIQNDRGDAVPDSLTWAKFGQALLDWKLWAFALMFASSTMPAYAFAYFAPVIIHGMGYSGGIANLMSAPPVVFAVISAMIFARISDRIRMRAPAIFGQCCVVIMGLMMTAYSTNDYVRYVGIFFGTAGCQGNIPAVLAYQSNNIRLQSKRAVGSALQIGFGAVGGVLASTTFLAEEAPLYRTGLWVTAAMQLMTICLAGFTTTFFWIRNKQQAEGRLKKPIEGQEGLRYTL
ncbi:hypothetical protein PMZ80_001960 [Knufia obscura]|uniref:Major facilitator superfamily (MFS) profile domain-containing protein n=1 Tax=Knufia obscura TaxID=1635080 RepID=A0ABR0RW09_9EURO|nr:hypothetical protein PMZ80_001960 [Knufia obscura]